MLHPLRGHIVASLLFSLTAACQHSSPTDMQAHAFADEWHLTAQQRSDLISKQLALDIQYWRSVLAHREAEVNSSKRLLSLVAKQTESGISRRSELLTMQVELSEDKIQHLQSSEQLRIAEAAFRSRSDGTASVEDTLSDIKPSGIQSASEKQVFLMLGSIENQDLFSALWSRYETSKAINKQCSIVGPLSSRIVDIYNKQLQLGLLSIAGYLHANQKTHQRQLKCTRYRHKLDSLELMLTTIVNARTS